MVTLDSITANIRTACPSHVKGERTHHTKCTKPNSSRPERHYSAMICITYKYMETAHINGDTRMSYADQVLLYSSSEMKNIYCEFKDWTSWILPSLKHKSMSHKYTLWVVMNTPESKKLQRLESSRKRENQAVVNSQAIRTWPGLLHPCKDFDGSIPIVFILDSCNILYSVGE